MYVYVFARSFVLVCVIVCVCEALHLQCIDITHRAGTVVHRRSAAKLTVAAPASWSDIAFAFEYSEPQKSFWIRVTYPTAILGETWRMILLCRAFFVHSVWPHSAVLPCERCTLRSMARFFDAIVRRGHTGGNVSCWRQP